MRVRLLGPAAAELDEAVAWYATQSAGLEQRFLDEVREAARLIDRYPHAWHPLGDGVRRFRLRRFPYALIYAVEQDGIVILAIAHLHREPTYWRLRLSKPHETD